MPTMPLPPQDHTQEKEKARQKEEKKEEGKNRVQFVQCTAQDASFVSKEKKKHPEINSESKGSM